MTIYQGRVTRVAPDYRVHVVIPFLNNSYEYGPMYVTDGVITEVGDRVLVSTLDLEREDFAVVGKIVGPDGPTPGGGGSGSDDFYLEVDFAVAANPWVINIPTRSVKDLTVETYTGGVPTRGTVTKPDDHTIQIDWYYPLAGTAHVYA